MGIIGWIVLGLIVGVLAKVILPGKDPGGIIVTTLIGIVGAIGGAYVGRAVGLLPPGFQNTFFDLTTWITALVGSLVLLLLYRLIFGRRAKVRR